MTTFIQDRLDQMSQMTAADWCEAGACRDLRFKKPGGRVSNAFHEAAHALAYMAHGFKIEQVWCDDWIGCCQRPRDATIAADLLAAAAGTEAAKMAGFGDQPSREDLQCLRDAMRAAGIPETRKSFDQLTREARQFLS